jgi:hypothetical protein
MNTVVTGANCRALAVAIVDLAGHASDPSVPASDAEHFARATAMLAEALTALEGLRLRIGQ